MINRYGYFDALYGDSLCIQWYLTDYCNYACSYCAARNIRQVKRSHSDFPSLEKMKIAIDNLAALNKQKYYFYFVGGEPTENPGLPDLADYVGKKIEPSRLFFCIISNGSKDHDYYNAIAKKVPLDLHISIHFEHAQKNRILHLIKTTAKECNIFIYVMFHPKYKNDVYDFVDSLKKLQSTCKFGFKLSLLRSDEKLSVDFDSRYIPDDFDYFYKVNDEAIPTNNKILKDYNDIELQFFCETIDNDITKIYYGPEAFSSSALTPLPSLDRFCACGTSVMSIYPSGACSSNFCTEKYDFYNIFKSDWLEKIRRLYSAPVQSKPDQHYFYLKKCPFVTCLCNSYAPLFLHEEEGYAFMENWRKRQLALMGPADSGAAPAGWLSIFQKEGAHFSNCFGFSAQEEWGCWSEENPCGFTVRALPGGGGETLTLLMAIYKQNFMTISVNGTTLYSNKYKGEHEIRLDLPAGLAEDGKYHVVIHLQDPLRTPAEEGGTDTRTLGIALRSVSLEPA